MYPFASLPENLAAFCRALNRDHDFHIGPRELADAARALQVAMLGDETSVRHALRPVLCTSREETALFDAAFRAFFHPSRGVEGSTANPADVGFGRDRASAESDPFIPPSHRRRRG